LDIRDKVAVITGAASGIGRELAIACAREGAKLVLADIDEKGLAETAGLVKVENITVRCDVSKPESLENLAGQTYKKFGAAHLVFNNAGVAVVGPAWTATLDDWKWVLDINLMGVVHGIRAFVPRMLKQGGEGHIVNTASMAGMISVPGSAVYCVSKHGVVTLSECLHHDLRMAKSKIGVSVLCPSFVPTGIGDSARNRPAELGDVNPMAAPFEAAVKQAVASGRLTAADVSNITIDAIKANRFYVLPHQKAKLAIESRFRDILDERQPTDAS